MSNYDWRNFRDSILPLRFPADARGYALWKRFAENFPNEPFNLVRRPQPIKWPRIFVSHKQADAHLALQLAYIAHQEGFDFWLDVLDPPLLALSAKKGKWSPESEALLTAGVIEMGLINCTHVIAAITARASKSRWIPYEYGRVKDSKSLVGACASWVAKTEKANVPEYLRLGGITYKVAEIRKWLRGELSEWHKSNPRASRGSVSIWPGDVPTINLDTAT